MPTISDSYHDNLIRAMKDLANQNRWYSTTLSLGGVPGSGGGSGVPIGGIYGQLIQALVAYDTTEAALAGGPVASGWSLVDNLNHIRYWINTKSPSLVVEDESVQVSSGVSRLNFQGAGITAVLAGDTINITVTATGSGGGGDSGITVIWEDVTSQVPAAGDNYTISQQAISGSIKAFLNGLLQAPTNITQTTGSFHTLFSPVSGDELVVTYLASGIPLASGISVYDDGALVASGVFKLNFVNSLVTYADGIATVSGLGGGGGDTDTKKVLVTSADTTEDYLQNKVRAGSNITVTLVSGGSNEFLQVASTASGTGSDSYKSKVTITDTTEDYLETKIRAGSNITITTVSGTGNAFLQIESTATGGGESVEIPMHGARIYSSSGIQIPTGQDYAIGFDSERWDTASLHSTSSADRGKLTCQVSGMYLLSAHIKFTSNSTGNRGLKIRYGDSNTVIASQFITNTTTNSCYMSAATVFNAPSGGYFTCSVYQSSGGNLELLREDGTSPEFAIQRLPETVYEGGVSESSLTVLASGVTIASGVESLNFSGGLCASVDGTDVTVTSASTASETENQIRGFAVDTSTRTYSADSTWETIVGTSIDFTAPSSGNYISTLSIYWRGTSANWLNHQVKCVVDGLSTNVTPSGIKLIGSSTNAVTTDYYQNTAVAVLSGIAAGSHSLSWQTQDSLSSLNREITLTTVTVIGP